MHINIQSTLSRINSLILSPINTIILIIAFFILIFKLRKSNLLNPIAATKAISRSHQNGVSSIQALSVALAGTLGVGNISGVAIALSLGGAGAIFWMWASALCAMIIKYSEVVLALHYREYENHEAHGGAMYYIKKGITNTKLSSLLSGSFAILCIISSFSTGSILQMNAATEAAFESYSINPLLFGIIIAILCIVPIATRSKVYNITTKIVPLMSIMFVMLSTTIIIINHKQLPYIFKLIITDAFKPNSAFGGAIGFIFSKSLRFGTIKGLYSNEAGCGTSTIAHAQADTKEPHIQGIYGIIEVFFDTIILCTLTALVLLISYGNNVPVIGGGVSVTLRAFNNSLGSIAKYSITLSIILFAYATIICWAYYGLECIRFFKFNRTFEQIYLIVYFFSIIYGAIAPSDLIWEIADTTICLMMSTNTICVCYMSNTVRELSIIKEVEL